jgi:ABC-type lipoprotein release transport system permease subunit
MKTLFTIAVRNLVRHRLRTLLTALTISVGVMAYMFVDSIMDGSNKDAFDNIVYLTGSSLMIHTAEYDSEKGSMPLQHGIPDPDAFMTALSAQPGVVGVAPRVRFLGELSNYRDILPVTAAVVDPQKDADVFRISRYVEAGTYFSADAGRQILVGKKLAADLGLKPGDTVVLSAQTANDVANADDFTVAGILNTPTSEINNSSVFITRTDGERLLSLGGLVTEVDVQLNWKTGAPFEELAKGSDALASVMKGRYPALVFHSVADQAKSFLALIGSKSKMSGIIILIVLAIALVGIVNTVLMSVYERVREVGVMRAMGFQGRDVLWMFLLEGAMIGFLGSLVGVLFGCAFVWQLVTHGMNLSAFGVDMAAFNLPISPVIYGVWKVKSIAFIFIFGVLSALLAAWLPARRAASFVVTRALRFE